MGVATKPAKTGKPPRIWRYEVTEVWGSMVGRLEVGAVILDKWKGRGEQIWTTFDMKKAKSSGGWAAKLLGEADEEATAQVLTKWGWRS